MKNKRTNRLLYYVIFILIFIMGGYILYEKYLIDDNKKAFISGKVVNSISSSQVFLEKRLMPKLDYLIIDSLVPNEDGTFKFSLPLVEPGYYAIRYKDSTCSASTPLYFNKNATKIYVTIDSINLPFQKWRNSNSKQVGIHGSIDNDLANEYFSIGNTYYMNYISPIKKQINQLSKQDESKHSRQLDSLNTLLKTYKKEQHEITKNIVINKMGSSISLYQVMQTWDETHLELVDTVLHRFKRDKLNSFITPIIIEEAKKLKSRIILNRPVINFVLKDSSSNLIDIKDYIGKKYILIDFWASWCGPCIKEIPVYKNIYDKYKDVGKGLEIISISTDKNLESWKQAISKNSIPWINLINEQENPSTAFKYGITELPTTFLIDLEGKIVKKNISIVDLMKILDN
ncbi:TlpA disulfide reductase family protein [uncultured Psychroserpens sp.]|uniref:TlpA family protein disulfide reductase n=1 Tax=uncultured Psychroserpens sp. TaxID=255436 RepID=UPI00261CBD99|nr:TlpA disulfide reductase family protein [uncultured Psychroserpens sp.]